MVRNSIKYHETYFKVHSDVSCRHFARQLQGVVGVVEAVAVNAVVLSLLLLRSGSFFRLTFATMPSRGVTRVRHHGHDDDDR